MQPAHTTGNSYTYADFITWPDEERWEIINGQAWNMSPTPSIRHQKIVGNLHGILFQAKAKFPDCALFAAPTDVVLDDINIVQPDVFVVYDNKKITEKNIKGAPELIFEVLSPSTAAKDKREKKELYEQYGVQEYIIIFPENEIVELYRLTPDGYGAPTIFNWDEPIPLAFLDLALNLWDFFDKEPPKPDETAN